MYFTTNQFRELAFCGPHNKPHVARGSGKHYHIRFDPKLGHGTYAICCIPCVCTKYTYTLDKPWDTYVTPHQQPYYQPVKDFSKCTVLGSNNYNNIIFSHKETSSEEIDKNN